MARREGWEESSGGRDFIQDSRAEKLDSEESARERPNRAVRFEGEIERMESERKITDFQEQSRIARMSERIKSSIHG
jgi:hypothetical protein